MNHLHYTPEDEERSERSFRRAKRAIIAFLLLVMVCCLFTCLKCRRGDPAPATITGTKVSTPVPVSTEHPQVTVISGGEVSPGAVRQVGSSQQKAANWDTSCPVLRVITDRDTVYLPADTGAIVRDYLARRTYNDTLKIDTAGVKGWVATADTVQFNGLQRHRITYHLTLPSPARTAPKCWSIGLQVGTTFDPDEKKAKPYIGAGISWNPIRF